MPRWILATARFSSKNLNYSSFKKLLDKLDYKKASNSLADFPCNKIKIAAFVLKKCPIVAYFVFRYKGRY